MFLALLTYHFYHPGRVLAGPGSEPGLTKEEKQLKNQQKIEAKEEKRRLKERRAKSNESSSERNAESDQS
jgi:hypothetical protein